MRFSLILATLGRYDELDRCLSALSKQIFKDFEVILIDQNEEGFLNELVSKYKSFFEINHTLLKSHGLSKARNTGLKLAKGEIIGFPDDDCEYFPDTLLQLDRAFVKFSFDGITGKVIHQKDIKSVTELDQYICINKYNVWKKSISFTIFFKRSVCEQVGSFNENLGVGSGTVYGSGEETDYLLRVLENNKKVFHLFNIEIFHPQAIFKNYKKAESYSYGRMYVLRKHKYNVVFVFCNIVYPLFKMCRYFHDTDKAKYYWYQFLGRVKFVIKEK